MSKTSLTRTDNIGGTSYYGVTITTSVNRLIEVLGEPHYEDEFVDEKVSVEWDFETENGLVFTIYDWKEYDNPACTNRHKNYRFHIGTKNSGDGYEVLEILKEYGL
jgi:hypothetical protein